MMSKFIKKFSLIGITVLAFSLLTPTANAEEIWGLYDSNGQGPYAQHVCGVDVCGPSGSFTTNPQTMASVSSNAGCPTICHYVHLDYYTRQPDGRTTTAERISSPSPTPTPTPTPSLETITASPSPTPSPTPTPTPTPAPSSSPSADTSTSTTSTTSTSSSSSSLPATPSVTGIAIQMFDLQGVSLYSRYCITGTADFVNVGSVNSTSTITDASGQVVSNKSTPTNITGVTTCNSGRQGSEFAYDEIKNLKSGTTYTLRVNAQIGSGNYSLTKTFTTSGGSVAATPSEAIKPAGLGGYAVVHPDGHVCGVIVATSSDPYGNGGTMPVEYMSCPIGSRIIFQTNPSPSGNVAGWHGENVIYNGSEFVIKNGNSDTSTVQTTIQGGVATDSSGRVWDTGSGATLKPGTSTTTDTRTVISDTRTATSDTSTSTTSTPSSSSDSMTSTTSTPAQQAAVKVSIPDSSTALQVIKTLTAVQAESQLVAKVISKNQSVIQVSTEFANALLQISASKKGAKTITLSLQTNDDGDAKLNLKTNLSGYTVSLQAGKVKLDTDKIK